MLKLRALRRKISRSNFVSHIAKFFIYNLGKTLTWEMDARDIDIKKIAEGDVITCFWHSDILMIPFLAQKHCFKKPGALFSPNSDGRAMGKIVKVFDIEPFFGSSNKKGFNGARSVLAALKENYSIAIVPDGPKGPAFKCKMGSVFLAKTANVKIHLFATNYEKKKICNTWDRFKLPYPFSKAVFRVSHGFDPNDYETLEAFNEAIENCLNEMRLAPLDKKLF